MPEKTPPPQLLTEDTTSLVRLSPKDAVLTEMATNNLQRIKRRKKEERLSDVRCFSEHMNRWAQAEGLDRELSGEEMFELLPEVQLWHKKHAREAIARIAFGSAAYAAPLALSILATIFITPWMLFASMIIFFGELFLLLHASIDHRGRTYHFFQNAWQVLGQARSFLPLARRIDKEKSHENIKELEEAAPKRSRY